ncbi:MAG: ATP-binding cassette domain-containing protein [Porticoccaceae bacterium]|jgi:branched-chain amino acid transport system ATP-binding protein|nr:ATP-binding cassette domain-containing protein [Porticoccaceae bacterium]HLS99359.1 ATP-binding cassette domain-containing protein [Porticoccaceae bacterium]
MGDFLLEARNLSAGYRGQAVVHDLDLRVAAGEIVCLFGPNGAGKTTSLLTLAGELPPIKGSTWLLGKECRAPLHERVRAGLSFITDERSLIFGLSTRDNLRLRGGSVADAVALFPELEPHLSRQAALLSGGQQQMVAMARSLAARPRVLIADELSMGLAPQIVARLLASLRRAADRGVAVLLVEQHLSQALAICDRAYILNHGRVVMAGSAQELKGQSAAIEAAYLFGPRASEAIES